MPPVVPTAAVFPAGQGDLLGDGSSSMTELAVTGGPERHGPSTRRASTTPGCTPHAAAAAAGSDTSQGAAELMTQAKRPVSPQKRKSSVRDAAATREAHDASEQEDAPEHKRPRLGQAPEAGVPQQQQQAAGVPQQQQQAGISQEQRKGPEPCEAAAGAVTSPPHGHGKGRSVLEVVLSPLFSVFGRAHNNHQQQQQQQTAAPAPAACALPPPEPASTASTATVAPATVAETSAGTGAGVGAGTCVDAATAAVAAVADRTHHAHHPPLPEVPEAAESEADADEEDDATELEFDPLLFIRSLPPLDQVVPRHRTALLPRKTRQCKRKTLVLDLDETLVHSSVEALAPGAPPPDFTLHVNVNHIRHTIHVRRRPHLDKFMTAVAALFEVVVFTASQKPYAEQLLNVIDPKRSLIKHRVFRDSCVIVDGNYLKDLTVLGRDMATTCIIDNSPHAFGFQPDNGIPIESWFDDAADSELLKLLPFLRRLAADEVDDVRPHIAAKFRLREMIAKLPPPL